MKRIEDLKEKLRQEMSGLLFAREELRITAKVKFSASLYDMVSKAQAKFDEFLNTKVERYFTKTLITLESLEAEVNDLKQRSLEIVRNVPKRRHHYDYSFC